ncbi:MAG: flagellar export protein FliJ [Eubacteriales bacterium]
MAKFTFRLNNVLEIKRKFENQQKNEFMNAKRILNEEEEMLVELDNYSLDIYEKTKMNRKETLQVRELLHNQAEIKYIENRILDQKRAIVNAKKRADKEQEKFAEMMKERKTYEQLKEREFEQFKETLKADEMVEIDELTSYQYGQRKD